MSSVSTAFKVHYNQKLGDPSGHLGGNAPWPLGDRRIRRSWLVTPRHCIVFTMSVDDAQRKKILLPSNSGPHERQYHSSGAIFSSGSQNNMRVTVR